MPEVGTIEGIYGRPIPNLKSIGWIELEILCQPGWKK